MVPTSFIICNISKNKNNSYHYNNTIKNTNKEYQLKQTKIVIYLNSIALYVIWVCLNHKFDSTNLNNHKSLILANMPRVEAEAPRAWEANLCESEIDELWHTWECESTRWKAATAKIREWRGTHIIKKSKIVWIPIFSTIHDDHC
jgi:hypothetical protein